jgi:hypothetical protein
MVGEWVAVRPFRAATVTERFLDFFTRRDTIGKGS